jgi:hypothetical protein
VHTTVYRQNIDHLCVARRATTVQSGTTELRKQNVEQKLPSALARVRAGPLTTPTTPDKAMILTLRHHCCLLTDRAPRLKAYACPASVSVLSTSKSKRSPLCKIESMFWTMISLLSISQAHSILVRRAGSGKPVRPPA